MAKNRLKLIRKAAESQKQHDKEYASPKPALPPEPKRVSVLNNIPKVCNECGYVAKGEGLAMLEDFIVHRTAHPEWNDWVEGWFT